MQELKEGCMMERLEKKMVHESLPLHKSKSLMMRLLKMKLRVLSDVHCAKCRQWYDQYRAGIYAHDDGNIDKDDTKYIISLCLNNEE
ncbi:hypothetical protein CHS0354_002170 [Potamilus streckersoni]|uniref:Uncharacterized protein n=1 Tax=Potamilus streckersoni TaxID=2493646 RepID=A0AAE0RS52_9BIVA|nr:hypothetical protein CHS0354_002170 [Potamilus streckersoni]